MAATTYVSGPWKAAAGTLQDILDELKSDGISGPDKVVGLTHDGTNFVVVYRYK